MFWVLVLLFLLTIILGPVMYWYYVLFKHRSLNKLPGPKPVMFIGYPFRQDPVGLFEDITELYKKYKSRFVVYTGFEVRIFHSKPEHMEFLLTLKNTTKSNSYDFFKPWIGDGILTATGQKWKNLRRIVTQSFHDNILDEFVLTFNNIGDKLVKALAKDAGEPVNICSTISMFSFDALCDTSMGTSMNTLVDVHGRKFLNGVERFLKIVTQRFFSYWKRFDVLFRLFSKSYVEQQKLLNLLHNFSTTVMEERREFLISRKEKSQAEIECGFDGKKKVTLIDNMLVNVDSNKMTTEEVREEIDSFLFGGHDTVASGTLFTFYALAQNLDVQQKVYEEMLEVLGSDIKDVTAAQLQQMQYLELVIKEALRMYTSVTLVERKIEQEFELDGVIYPRGVTVALGLYWLHHNPEVYPDPEKFDPERFLPENQSARHNFSYLPFSAGLRKCIGQKYSFFLMKTAVIKVMQKYEILPVPDFAVKLCWAPFLKASNGCYIKLAKRKIHSTGN